MCEWVGEFGLPLHHLAEERGQNLRHDGQHVGVEAGHGSQRGSHCGAIHQCQPFLGLQLEWLLNAGHFQSLDRRHRLPILRHSLRIRPRGKKPCKPSKAQHQIISTNSTSKNRALSPNSPVCARLAKRTRDCIESVSFAYQQCKRVGPGRRRH